MMTQKHDGSYDEEVALESKYLMKTYGRKPVEFVAGSGMHLTDSEGNDYLDFIAGIGAVSLGHCDPDVTRAVTAQASKLIQVSNYYYVEHRGEAAQKISNLLARNEDDALGNTHEQWRTFFCNSGAEANEGAIKLARHYGNDSLHGATTIVCAKRSFHGRTLATLFATGQASKQEAFVPAVPGFAHVPINDIPALEEALRAPGVVALMLECIQGEGGVYPCTDEYLKAARRLTLENGQLLILDEVQTGFFRTGSPFAFQKHGIVPDIVSMAKGIGGGIAMGAFAAPDKLACVFKPGEHGSTFGGNPLVCASADAVLTAFDERDIEGNVRKVGAYMRERLETLPHKAEVRGEGLMLAVELDGDYAVQAVEQGLTRGLVLNYVSPSILRFLPPLIVTEEDVDVLIDKLSEILEGIA